MIENVFIKVWPVMNNGEVLLNESEFLRYFYEFFSYLVMCIHPMLLIFCSYLQVEGRL